MAGPSSAPGDHLTSDHEYANRTAWRTLTSTNPEAPSRQQTTAAPARVAQDSRFLDLPAELRNTIYELAVLDHSGGIEICLTLREPALLSVCSQTRDEASAIYYKQNKFWYDALSLNTIRLNQWSTKTAAAAFSNLDVYIFLPSKGEEINWLWLITWCREITYKEGARTLIKGEGMDATEKFICRALATAEDEEKEFESWTDMKNYVEGEALAARYDVDIDFDEYTFVDGFDFDFEECSEKVCGNEEEERPYVDCRFCRLSPQPRAG